MANTEFMLLILATIKIQSVARSYIAAPKYRCILNGVVSAQANFRGRKVRQATAILHKNAAILQSGARRFLARLEWQKRNDAVATLQRAARIMVANMHSEVECFAATEIQAVVRGRQARNVVAIQLRAVSTLQRAARAVINGMHNEANEVEQFAATEIQRVWRGYRANVDYLLLVLSAIKIQAVARVRHARRVVADKKEERRIRVLQRAASNSVEKVEMRQAHKRLTVQITSDVDGLPNILRRRQPQPLVLSPVPSPQPLVFPVPPPQFNTPIRQPSKFERHTNKAIRTVQKSKKFTEVLKAVLNLEKITQQSIEDCQLIIEANAHHKLFSIIRSCNRSSPHLDLVRVILSVLSNIAQHPLMLKQMANDEAIGSLTELVQLFRDKSNIFALSSSLLEQMLHSSYQLRSNYATLENKMLLAGILVLCKEKAAAYENPQRGINSLENVMRIIVNTSGDEKSSRSRVGALCPTCGGKGSL